MNLVKSIIFTGKFLKDKDIPNDMNRLRALSAGCTYSIPSKKLFKLIQNETDKKMEWLLMKKAYFSLDSSLNFIEKYQNRIFFKSALKKAWGVEKKEQLIQQINFLFDGSNSLYANAQLNLYSELQIKELPIDEISIRETDFFNYYYEDLDEDQMEHLIGALNIIEENKNLLTSNWVLGFDLSRIVHLVRMGYGTKILSQNEAWEIIDKVYLRFKEFKSYADFFASHELGFNLFDYDRELDCFEQYKDRVRNAAPIFLNKRATPFKYLNISDDIRENPGEIFENIFHIDSIEIGPNNTK